MSGNRLDEFSEDELSPLERQKMRRLLLESDRAHWLWGFMLKAIIGISALAAAAAVLKGWVIAAGKVLSK